MKKYSGKTIEFGARCDTRRRPFRQTPFWSNCDSIHGDMGSGLQLLIVLT